MKPILTRCAPPIPCRGTCRKTRTVSGFADLPRHDPRAGMPPACGMRHDGGHAENPKLRIRANFSGLFFSRGRFFFSVPDFFEQGFSRRAIEPHKDSRLFISLVNISTDDCRGAQIKLSQPNPASNVLGIELNRFLKGLSNFSGEKRFLPERCLCCFFSIT